MDKIDNEQYDDTKSEDPKTNAKKRKLTENELMAIKCVRIWF